MGRTKRGGRKRRQGKREPNGQLSRRNDDKQARRSIDEQANMRVAREARERIFGVKEEASGTELAGTVCGRLLLSQEISRQQMDAAVAFAATYAAYQRAIDSPRPPKAVEIGAPTGRGALMDVTPEQAKRAAQQWEAAKSVIRDANCEPANRGSQLYAACDYLVLRDEFHEHMVGDLRIALNALSRHYGLVARAA